MRINFKDATIAEELKQTPMYYNWVTRKFAPGDFDSPNGVRVKNLLTLIRISPNAHSVIEAFQTTAYCRTDIVNSQSNIIHCFHDLVRNSALNGHELTHLEMMLAVYAQLALCEDPQLKKSGTISFFRELNRLTAIDPHTDALPLIDVVLQATEDILGLPYIYHIQSQAVVAKALHHIHSETCSKIYNRAIDFNRLAKVAAMSELWEYGRPDRVFHVVVPTKQYGTQTKQYSGVWGSRQPVEKYLLPFCAPELGRHVHAKKPLNTFEVD